MSIPPLAGKPAPVEPLIDPRSPRRCRRPAQLRESFESRSHLGATIAEARRIVSNAPSAT